MHSLLQVPQPLLPAYVLHHLQRKLAFWAEQQSTLDGMAAFLPRNVIDDTASGDMSWQIPIPSGYLQQRPLPFAAPPVAPGVSPAAPPTRPAPAAAPSPRPAPALPPPATPPTQSVVRREGGPDARFATIAARNIPAKVPKDKIRRGELTPPLDNQGRQRCLAWSCKGLCNTRCGQVADHRMDHTEEEQNTLLAWCNQHWVA